MPAGCFTPLPRLFSPSGPPPARGSPPPPTPAGTKTPAVRPARLLCLFSLMSGWNNSTPRFRLSIRYNLETKIAYLATEDISFSFTEAFLCQEIPRLYTRRAFLISIISGLMKSDRSKKFEKLSGDITRLGLNISAANQDEIFKVNYQQFIADRSIMRSCFSVWPDPWLQHLLRPYQRKSATPLVFHY